MKPYLKIAGALAALAALVIGGISFFSHRTEKAEEIGDIVTINGHLEAEHFFQAKELLTRSTAAKKTVVITNSTGGNWETNLGIATLIHDHGWDVEVVDLCASSCAIFIFPAGKKKYLHPQAMLAFHGGPHQENLKEQIAAMKQSTETNGAPVEAHPERIDKEGRVSLDPERAPLRKQIRDFLGIVDATTDEEIAARMTEASDRFYEHLGINILLPHFGQIGQYESIYKSYKHHGFMYRLDSLERLGVRDIEVKGGGEWRPERNPVYQDVYEVEYR